MDRRARFAHVRVARNVIRSHLNDSATVPGRELKQGSDNIVYGLGPLYVVKADATTLTFARDGNKNVRAELASSGSVTAAVRYRSYGQIAQSTATAPGYLGFTSQLVDPSGLFYMRARWYEPSTGRFVTRDPATGDAQTPASLNAYGYAHANPVMNLDPTGLFCLGASIGGNFTIGTISLFGSSVGGAAGVASGAFMICGGGRTGLNVGFVGSVGAFSGTPKDTGIVPEKAGNVASGAYAGEGFAGVVSPNATKISDFGGAFTTQTLNLGIGPLNGSVEYSGGKNENREDIDVLSVSPPGASVGIGASFAQMNTTSLTGTIWSQSGGWLSE